MLIKILINGTLTACAASVPVAAGTYVYLCSEEAKALSHESLSLKLLQKKPVPKAKKPEAAKPEQSTSPEIAKTGAAANGGQPSKGNSDSKNSPSSVGSSVPQSSQVAKQPVSGGGDYLLKVSLIPVVYLHLCQVGHNQQHSNHQKQETVRIVL